jgi:predicted 3-demethylubiquinone-9 3-methyltransferase (glyoxalase superfamily)
MQKIVTNLWFDGRVEEALVFCAALERTYRNE